MAVTQCIKAFRNGDLGDAECGRQLGLLGVVQKGENIQ